MRQLQNRAEQLARAQQRRAIARMAAELAGKVRGAEVETGDGGVVLTGRRLLARWLVDPSLRFVADMRK